MPATARRTPETILSPARGRLADAITKRRLALSRIEALEAAQPKARRDCWDAADELREAEASLAEAKRDEPSRLVDALVGGVNTTSPVADAEARLQKARERRELAHQVEVALTEELERAESYARLCRSGVNAALANVIAESVGFQKLAADLDAAWASIRTTRKIVALLHRSCSGNLPHQALMKFQVDQTTSPDVVAPYDPERVTLWEAALAALAAGEADATLPE